MRKLLQHCTTLALLALACLYAGCDYAPGEGLDAFAEPFQEPTPAEAAQNANNFYDPDVRRDGLSWLAQAYFADETTYQNLFKLNLEDPEPSVRAVAIGAIGRSGQPSDIPTILRYMEDESEYVRWATAAALQKLHNPVAIDPLIKAMQADKSIDVRLNCAIALRQYREERVLLALIDALSDDAFAVVDEARISLELMTGQKYEDDSQKWFAWSNDTPQSKWFDNASIYYYPRFVPKYWIDQLLILAWLKEEEAPRQPKGMFGIEDADAESVVIPEE